MTRAPRLHQLAEMINRDFPELEAVIERGYCNTDRKPRGCRYITRKGKGRTGNELIVYSRRETNPSGIGRLQIFRHNAAETYRRNSEVVDWIENLKGRRIRVLAAARPVLSAEHQQMQAVTASKQRKEK